MYVIVDIQGQQFNVEQGRRLFIHHVKGAESGAKVEFNKVLLVDKDGAVTVGTPTVAGAKVVCEILTLRGSARDSRAKTATPGPAPSPPGTHGRRQANGTTRTPSLKIVLIMLMMAFVRDCDSLRPVLLDTVSFMFLKCSCIISGLIKLVAILPNLLL